MKNILSEVNGNIFAEFILSNEEMNCVRGGEDDPKTNDPTIKI
jgi:hypothetical protein